MVDTVLKIPGAPGGVELTDEELDKMPVEQLQALQKQYAVPDVGADVRKQIIPGLKEGGAGLLGSPAELASAGAGILSAGNVISPETERNIRAATAPFGQQAWAETKFPFVGQALKLSPEEQQPPKTFPGQVTRTFSSYLPSLGAAAPFAGAEAIPYMTQALLRSGAAAGLSEGAGRVMEAAGTPEAAPYARALAAPIGFGPVQGFKASAARGPSATMLERAGMPVSAAQRSGSRLAATLEQQAPAGAEGVISKLRQGQLDPQENNWAVRQDLGKVWVDASNSGAPATVVNPVNREIGRFQAAAGPKAKPISADEYFKMSKKWGDSNNPYVQQLGDVLDRHMAQQNPAWEGMRDRLDHVPDLKSLSKAQERVPFPEPYKPDDTYGALMGPAAAGAAHLAGFGPTAAESAMLFSLMGLPKVTQTVMKGIGPLFRSAPGQAYMSGWPGSTTANYAALLAGPVTHHLQDITKPKQQPNE